MLYFGSFHPLFMTEIIISHFIETLLPCLFFFCLTNLQIPVLVSKQIVFEDAIRVSYGFGRVHERKSCFDVLLDWYKCEHCWLV